MRQIRLWVLVLVAALCAPSFALAQNLTTINKPGQVLSNVSTEDEKGKPLKLKKGEKVTVVYSRDDWMWVKTKGGRSGWVLKKEVKVEDAAAAAEAGKKKDDDKGKQAAADEAKKKKEDDKAAKQAAAEEAKKKKEDEKAAKQAAADEAKKKKEDEKAAKQAAADEAKKKKEDEKAAKQAAADEAKKKKEEEKAAVEAKKAEPATVLPPTAPAGTPTPAATPVATPGTTAVQPATPTATPAATPGAAVATPVGDQAPPASPRTAPTPDAASPVDVAPAVAVAVEPAVAAPPPPGPGYLTIRASEPGAVVLLDGRRVGQAPIKKLAVDGGRHQVTVIKDDFTPSWQEVEVNGNETVVNLALAPTDGLAASQMIGAWVKRGIGAGIMLAGGAVATLAVTVGFGGTLLWVASANAGMWESLVQDGKYGPLSSPVFLILGFILTAVSPMVALTAALMGAAGGGLLLALAGDPSRYSHYGE
jgi:hypothetical protein